MLWKSINAAHGTFNPFRALVAPRGHSSQGVGVVKSLKLIGSGPVGLVRTQNFGIKSEKPTLDGVRVRSVYVCFRGDSGHRISSASCLFMTQLGHVPQWGARFLPMSGTPDHFLQCDQKIET